jgi:Predicted membrane protein (DUF2142)
MVGEGARSPRRAPVALAIGLAAMVVAVCIVLSGSPLVRAGTNSVPPPNVAVALQGSAAVCQLGGTIPRGTTAIRIPFVANAGPRVVATVMAGSRVLTTGAQAAGWGSTDTVTVPVTPVTHQTPGTRVCIAIGPITPFIAVDATASRRTSSTSYEPRNDRLHLEYLRYGSASWWSLAPSIAQRLGVGHAALGTWNWLLALMLMLAVAALASHLALAATTTSKRRPAKAVTRASSSSPTAGTATMRTRTLLGRIPSAAWTCALIACLNAVCWSIITPPFQVPDEPSHFAYTQQLAENQRLPVSTEASYSQEEQVALNDLHQGEVRRHPENHAISTSAEQQQLQHDLAEHLSRRGNGAVGVSGSEPPLYFLLEAIPYELGSPGTLLDQLELMRLLSAVMAGITALFSYMFIRETLPGVRRAWAVGGLGVALAPLLGFMSGGVSPDAMLYAVSAAILYAFAHAFRRGLTQRQAVTIGVLTAVGLLTKLNFVGLIPGVALGLVVLAVRAPQADRRRAFRHLGLALAIAASPVCVYAVVNLLSSRPGLGIVSTAVKQEHAIGTAVSYIWDFYLPHLPGMSNQFGWVSMPRQVWFDRSVGLYGWFDTTFPLWVDNLALVLVGVLILLCIRALFALRVALRRHLVEIVVYGVMGIGLALLVAASNYLDTAEGLGYAQPRYLLPMIPLLGVALALAARGAGRRWGPSVGMLLVVLVLAHDVFSQLLVIARYYG